MNERDTFFRIIEEALPYIAQTAGGDAVIFDRQGRRLKAYHPDGTHNPEAEGVLNSLCRKAMEELRPSIGPSVMAPGSIAVRIPLTPDYGLAFNNRHADQQRQRLLDSARHYNYARYHSEDIIGQSPAITQAKKLAREAAKTNSTILIVGETGTGKELFAQAIHNMSERAARTFVAINCGALPADLVESTLFGYMEGAFTGAKVKGHIGAIEQADGGTLFLDEISEMPLPLQVKLLRVIQEREVTRVGDTRTRPVDVRFIAATNRDLASLVAAGKFRADLYYRLNVLEIVIPPLRDRMDDLLPLINFMMKKFSTLMGKTVNDITPAALQALMQYKWPGNVRELQNCIEHIFNVIDVNCTSIGLEHLPRRILQNTNAEPPALTLYDEYMRNAERQLVLKALELTNYNQAAAARRLGINRTTLWRILKRQQLLPERCPREHCCKTEHSAKDKK